jgi:hypothetical protein
VKVLNGRAVESSVAKFCGRDHYSLFQTCFEDMPACHASLNGMQNGSKSKHPRKFWFYFQCHILKLSQEYWENETVTHRCHAASMHRRSWKLERADERFLHDEDSSNTIFCY